MKKLIIFLGASLVATLAQAQIVLDNFNTGTASGSTSAAVLGYTSSWVGQVTQNATTITVGGSANNDNGWGATGLNLNATGLNWVTVTLQRDAVDTGLSFTIQFIDSSLNTQVVSSQLSNFGLGSLTTVSIPVAWTIDQTSITDWNIGGGTPSPGSASYKVTFDNLSLTSTAAVPEPATYAALAGVMALGFVAYRRRQQAA